MEKLTVAMQNYLKAVYELSGNREGARVSDIAARLEVSKSSVCMAMKVLQEKKLVQRDAYHKVFLTLQGRSLAVSIIETYETIRIFLIKVLNIDSATARRDAFAIQYVISRGTLYSMRNLIESG